MHSVVQKTAIYELQIRDTNHEFTLKIEQKKFEESIAKLTRLGWVVISPGQESGLTNLMFSGSLGQLNSLLHILKRGNLGRYSNETFWELHR